MKKLIWGLKFLPYLFEVISQLLWPHRIEIFISPHSPRMIFASKLKIWNFTRGWSFFNESGGGFEGNRTFFIADTNAPQKCNFLLEWFTDPNTPLLWRLIICDNEMVGEMRPRRLTYFGLFLNFRQYYFTYKNVWHIYLKFKTLATNWSNEIVRIYI